MKKNGIEKISFLVALLAIFSIIATIIAIYGYRDGKWNQLISFDIIGYASLVCIGSWLIAIYSIIQLRKKLLFLNILTLLLTTPLILATGMFHLNAKIYPRINDITTDTKNPPMFWEINAPLYPDSNKDIQSKAYPDVKTLIINKPKDKVFQKALELVKQNSWKLIAKDSDEGQIEALTYSFAFRFVDEIVIRIQAADDGTTLVDMRSRSRLGKIDRGVNAKRILNFFKALQ